MKKIFLVFLFIFSLSLFILPAHHAHAFMSLVDNVDADCLTNGNCVVCDLLQIAVNFGKFIFITMAGLVLMFFMWQASGMVMNWGNAEATKVAIDKIKSTLLAALIILAAYVLVGILLALYSGNSFKTMIKGQASANWNIGPICERGDRDDYVNKNTINQNISSGGCGNDAGTICTCQNDISRGGCNCGGITSTLGQCQDASYELENLLECIRYNNGENLPLTITSISDSAGLAHCRDNYASDCAHSRTSCHYGGSGANRNNGSYAADFRVPSEMNWPLGDRTKYEKLVKNCNGNFIDWKQEAETSGHPVAVHFHVSASACSGQ